MNKDLTQTPLYKMKNGRFNPKRPFVSLLYLFPERQMSYSASFTASYHWPPMGCTSEIQMR
jgi:hypothetical protein